VAILRHGLYAIDVIISRALVYGLLSAGVTAIYAGIVAGFGTLAGVRGGPVLTVAAGTTPRSRRLPRELLAWEPTGPSLLEDLEQDDYYRKV
jgi:hypothetical protein